MYRFSSCDSFICYKLLLSYAPPNLQRYIKISWTLLYVVICTSAGKALLLGPP